MDKQTLKAEERKITGRKVSNLRKEGILPANIYGKKVKSLSVQVKADDFVKTYKEVGETGVLELEVGKEKRPVLIHKVQLNPVSDKPIHVDFLQVDLKEKVTANIQVELSGESPAEKQALGTVVLYINQVEVTALPGDLPEKFEVDISSLTEVDQAIHIKDLPFDKKKIEVTQDPETILAKVEPPQKEEVVAPPAPAEGEVPAEGAQVSEGEASTEGGEKPTEGQPAEASKEEPKE